MSFDGKWVSVEYTGMLEDGSIFDSSEGRSPLTFQVGAGEVIKGFDDAVKEMVFGEEKEIKIPCIQAYGQKNETVLEMPLSSFEDVSVLEEGKELLMMTNMGPMNVLVKVIDKEKGMISVNINHPLAGKDLIFKIKVIKELTEEEISAVQKERLSRYTGGCSCDDCSQSCDDEVCDNSCHTSKCSCGCEDGEDGEDGEDSEDGEKGEDGEDSIEDKEKSFEEDGKDKTM